jgi:YD repeat-containing protein
MVDGPKYGVDDITSYSYYNDGLLESVSLPCGLNTIYNKYDNNGNLLATTGANGDATIYSYDAMNRVKTIMINNDPELVSTYYYENGLLDHIVYPDGSVSYYDYDNYRRLFSTRYRNTKTEYSYDNENNVTETYSYKDGELIQTGKTVYDEKNRPEYIYNGIELVVQYSYYDDGSLKWIKDGNGNAVTYFYDDLNRLSDLETPLGTISYSYNDDDDQLETVTDPEGKIASYIYDDSGRLKTVTEPDSGTSSMQYEDGVNVTYADDANGNYVTTQYDECNRITHKEISDTNNQIKKFDYSYIGSRLETINTDNYSLTYGYDDLGNVNQETISFDGKTYIIAYTYNKITGNLENVRYPNGRIIYYTYDEENRLKTVNYSVGEENKNLIKDINYETFINTVQYGNNVVSSVVNKNDKTYKLSEIKTEFSADQDKNIDFSYTIDKAGNITNIDDLVDNSKSREFGYDEVNRLRFAHGPWKVQNPIEYTYDKIGNLKTKSCGGEETLKYDYYPNTNKIQMVKNSRDLSNPIWDEFQYDAVGNVKVWNRLDSSNEIFNRVLNYNQSYQLESIENKGNKIADYSYDIFDQRIKKIIYDELLNQKISYFIYDKFGNLISETDESGTPIVDYIYVGNSRIAKIETDLLLAPNIYNLEVGDGKIEIFWGSLGEGYAYSVYMEVNGEHIEVTSNLVEPSYEISGLMNEREYCFAVTARKNEQESAYSQKKCATPTAHPKPVAYIEMTYADDNNNRNLDIEEEVSLNGYGYNGQDKEELLDNITCVWEQVSGSYIAPSITDCTYQFIPNLQGNYKFSLVVNDGVKESDKIYIEIKVNDTNHAPIINCPNFTDTISVEEIVKLSDYYFCYDQDEKVDEDNNYVNISYEWLPTNSLAQNLNLDPKGLNGEEFSFTPIELGDYEFRFTCIDSKNTKATCDITVPVTIESVENEDENIRPIANAGDDQHVNIGQLVTLDGSLSYDPDGEIVYYQWYQIFGDEEIIHGVYEGKNLIIVPDTKGVYEFKLNVGDNNDLWASDYVLIYVESEGVDNEDLPQLVLDYEENISGCEPVIIDARASFDPLNPAKNISYYIYYSIISAPYLESSDFASVCEELGYKDSGLFCFEPSDGENEYILGFNIKLPDGRKSLSEQAKINVNCNKKPIANIDGTIQVQDGEFTSTINDDGTWDLYIRANYAAITFDGSGSYVDGYGHAARDGYPISYRWDIEYSPFGRMENYTNSSNAPAFSLKPIYGKNEYKVELTISNEGHLTDSSNVVLNVDYACNDASVYSYASLLDFDENHCSEQLLGGC